MPKQPDDPLEFDEKPTFGSRLIEILRGGAEGFAQGAGNSDIPEAAFARGFAGGVDRGQASAKAGRLSKALESFRASPDYQTLTPLEKTAYRADPINFLRERASRKNETKIKVRLSEVIPNITPELDRELDLSEGQVLQLQGALDRRDQAKALAQEREIARQERAQQARERQEGMTSRNVDLQVQKFSKNVEDLGIPEAVTQFKAIQKLIPKEGDIPGFGMAEGLVPGFAASESARAARQAVAALQNVKIKDRSGAAVTPPEFERLKEEFGSGKFKTEAQLRQGIQQAVSAYRERLRNAFAGYRPEIRGQYFENQNIDDYLQTLDAINFGGVQSSDKGGSSGIPTASTSSSKGIALQGDKASRLAELRRKQAEGTIN